MKKTVVCMLIAAMTMVVWLLLYLRTEKETLLTFMY